MRQVRRWALALAGALFALVPAEAADGIKASATASRDVPADILVVSFQITERTSLEGADQLTILAKALEDAGLKVLERSARYGSGHALGSGYGPGQPNVISGAGGAGDFVALNKHVAFRVGGFKRLDDVIEVFARHGVRKQIGLTADHSRAQAVLHELEKEAIELAITQARKLAAHAGVKTSGVANLAAEPGPVVLGLPPEFLAQAYLTALQGKRTPDQALIAPPHPTDLPRLRFSVSATVVLAIKVD